MIGRLLGGAVTVVVYVLAATLLSEAVILGYLWSTWRLDRQKLTRIVAIAQEQPAPSPPQPTQPEPGQTPPEEPSFEQILQRRAEKVRDLELRESGLRHLLEEIKAQQRKLTQEQEALAAQTQAFEAQVAALADSSRAAGRDIVRRTLENLKPVQAKLLLLDMLARQETADVVLLLTEMSESKRAKIIGEFKTPEEQDKITEVLRLIRQGQPQATKAEQPGQPANPVPTSGA